MSEDLNTSPASFYSCVPGTGVPRLFRHTRREEWGLGIVVHAQDDRVDLQFQDGQSRSFKKEFLHLLDPVEHRLDVAMGIIEALRGMSDSAGSARSDAPRPVTVDEQIAFFGTVFPKGFADDAYLKEHRGDGRKRPLKRHREPLIALAAELFPDREHLLAQAEQDPTAVLDAAGKLAGSTDLVSVAERKRFLDIKPSHHLTIARALCELMFGEGENDATDRFEAFVAALDAAMGGAPSWSLVTLFVGARFPEEHVMVHESSYGQQALFMAPGLSVPDRPMGMIYERLSSMAKSVRELLVKAGLEPRDLVDVTDFIQITLKSKAQQQIREKREADKAEAEKKALRATRTAAA